MSNTRATEKTVQRGQSAKVVEQWGSHVAALVNWLNKSFPVAGHPESPLTSHRLPRVSVREAASLTPLPFGIQPLMRPTRLCARHSFGNPSSRPQA
jgi:hypothetical protein